jgi:hypothetical protein
MSIGISRRLAGRTVEILPKRNECSEKPWSIAVSPSKEMN